MIVTDKQYPMNRLLLEKLDVMCDRCTGNKKMDNWIATFDAGTATNAQLQTFAARVLRELKRLRGG